MHSSSAPSDLPAQKSQNSVSIDLSGKIAVVTGASQGIGEQIARRLHEAGAKIILNHPGLDSTRADTVAIASELCSHRAESAFVVEADVSKKDEVQQMMRWAADEFGGLDFLINNAAILRDRTLAKMSFEEWQSVIDVNLTGVFLCCKYGIEIMRDQGVVVSTSSIAALAGFYGQSNYAAAKAGVAGLTRVLASETARRGIRVNAIAPGVIETAMAAMIPEKVREKMLENIPLGRFGMPSEIADVVLFLCSPLASYVTGQTIEINGGWRG
jgi:3-oxoacyl-[acyl-carrier protein] reductase